MSTPRIPRETLLQQFKAWWDPYAARCAGIPTVWTCVHPKTSAIDAWAEQQKRIDELAADVQILEQKIVHAEQQRDELLAGLEQAEAGLRALRENYQRTEGIGFESLAAGTAFAAHDAVVATIAKARGQQP